MLLKHLVTTLDTTKFVLWILCMLTDIAQSRQETNLFELLQMYTQLGEIFSWITGEEFCVHHKS
jgi:hypothetical protein